VCEIHTGKSLLHPYLDRQFAIRFAAVLIFGDDHFDINNKNKKAPILFRE
jgi:hypothetical protein